MRKTLLPSEYGCIGLSCGYNVIKRKKELTNFNEKKIFQSNKLYRKENLLYFYRFVKNK